MSTTAPRADAAAASVGATDLFVLRRVTGERFVHFGGAGRGAGWAGLIEVGMHDAHNIFWMGNKFPTRCFYLDGIAHGAAVCKLSAARAHVRHGRAVGAA